MDQRAIDTQIEYQQEHTLKLADDPGFNREFPSFVNH